MQVVGSEQEKPVESKESAPEDYTIKLTADIEKADRIAKQIKEKTIGIPFSQIKLSQLTRWSFDECGEKINFISRFGYLESKKIHGVVQFSIISDPAKRIEDMEQAKNEIKASVAGQLSYYTAMQQITQTLIEGDEAKTPVTAEDVLLSAETKPE